MKGQPVTGCWLDRFLGDVQQNLAAQGRELEKYVDDNIPMGYTHGHTDGG